MNKLSKLWQNHHKLLISLGVLLIIIISILLWLPHEAQNQDNQYRKMFSNVRQDTKSATLPMDRIPNNWNNPNVINQMDYPTSLKRPIYFQLMNRPSQTFVATKWKWSKTIPSSFSNKNKFKGITGAWYVVQYHRTNRHVKLIYSLPSLPTYITYQRSKIMTEGTPLNVKHGFERTIQ